MKVHALLILGFSIAAPSLLFAQTYPEPVEPATAAAAPAPRAPKAPRAALPPAAPAPEPLQAPAPKPAAAPAPATPMIAPMPPAAPRPPGQMINVRIDVTLSDSKGTHKTLTMTVADGESGMNRTTSVLPVGQAGGDYSFNADARPSVIGNKVRLGLTADAVVPVENDKASPANGGRLGLRQSQTLILNDGESVEIARAADPVSDRVFALSVKVTIQR